MTAPLGALQPVTAQDQLVVAKVRPGNRACTGEF